VKGPPPSDQQKSDFLRIAAVVKSPLSLLGELHSGRVTQDQVDAVQALYPELYKQVQQTALTAIADRKAPLPYEKRKTLGILLAIPTDPILQPAVVSAMQASYSPGDTGDSPPPGGPPAHGKAPKLKTFASSVSSDLSAADSRTRA
jgi:hypothetical protein